jgi:hypothetical protein
MFLPIIRRFSMREIKLFLLFFVFFTSTMYIYAQEDKLDDKIQTPPGMEIKKVGDLNIVVPRGAEVRRTEKVGLIFVESTDQYVSRQLLEMEDRFAKIEAEQEELKKEIELLKEAIDQLGRRSIISKEKLE